MADVRIVFSMIADSARTLHLDPEGSQVEAARRIAIEAVNDGRSEEDAFTFARSALIPSANMTAA